jgi:predicted Zn-dependent protease
VSYPVTTLSYTGRIAPERWPDSTGIRIQDTISRIYCRQVNASRATELLTSVQSRNPHDPTLFYHLDMALLKKGRREEARGLLRRSMVKREELTSLEGLACKTA